MEIVVGTKKWSSWSLRPWLALKRTGEAFKETVVELRQVGASEAEIARHSPQPSGAGAEATATWWSGTAGDLRIPGREVPRRRAVAHGSGPAGAGPVGGGRDAFGLHAAARRMPDGAGSRAAGGGELSEATQKDVRKIVERWNQLLGRSGGPFLVGEWSIADAFYTPVATRFRTYGVHLSDYGDTGPAGAYCERLG